MITVYFDQDTPLGRKIVFVPRGRPHFTSPHPVTDILNAIVARTHGTAPVSEVYGTPWANNPDYTVGDKGPDA